MRTPAVAAGCTGKARGRHGGRVTEKKIDGRVTKVSMVGGSDDDNRSVEEEWPFHKSRYA